jgi:ABC-2 type transport system ATP-binding protein
MLAAFELEPTVLDAPVRTSSKGMTQKLGLAACLLARKALYVLDEPASGLDPKARALFKDRLAALRPAGATVFFTSHALADVEEICDRLAVLHAGRVVFAGTPGALRAATGAASLEAAFLRCIGGARTAA